MRDYIVVGGGMGGVLSAALLSKQNSVLLLEKEPYLGGCASTFERGGNFYNAGATTLAAYEEGLVVHELFERIGFTPLTKPLEYSHIVLQGNHRIKLYADVGIFVEELNACHYHPKNLDFWMLVKRICDDFYKTAGYAYSGKNSFAKLKSALSFTPLALKFFPYLTKNANSFIKDFFDGELSRDYQMFLDSQTIIAVQADTSKINFLTAALALGYPFFKNHYVFGGMGTIFEGISQKISEVRTQEEVTAIDKIKGGYAVHTKSGCELAKSVILNTPVFSSAKFFKEGDIVDYFSSKRGLDSGQSAFTLYVRIKSAKEYAHHYQIISASKLDYTISNAVFVSFSDKNDAKMCKDGYCSVTASVHTATAYWDGLDKNEYRRRKNELKNALFSLICDTLDIKRDDTLNLFAATPLTFGRYIGRSSLGGVVMTPSNMLKVASNDTPFDGLYCVGDTSFAAQGWPGVAIGVRNLICTM